MSNLEELQQRLSLIFQEEAQERVARLESALFELRQNPLARAALQSAYLEAHSIKGAARSAGVRAIERICQGLESQLSLYRNEERSCTPEAAELALEGCQAIKDALLRATKGEAIDSGAYAQLLRRLDVVGSGESGDRPAAEPERSIAPAANPGPPVIAPALESAMRIPVERVHNLLRRADEWIVGGEAMASPRTSLEELRQLLRRVETKAAAAVEVREHAALAATPSVGQALPWQLQARQLLRLIDRQLVELSKGMRSHGAAFRESARALLVLPAHDWLELLRLSIESLAREQGCKVQVSVAGGDIEADRMILEEMRTPLLHLLRNAIAHGVETLAERLAAGKGEALQIALRLALEPGARLLISVADDGRGLDAPALRRRAVAMGIIEQSEAELLDEARSFNLIFHPGLSTRQNVDEVSGRGVGMSIVRDAVDRLGGNIQIHSQPGKGAEFVLRLPSRMSAFRAIVVGVGLERFCIPATAVLRVQKLDRTQLADAGQGASLLWQGAAIPACELGAALGVASAAESDGHIAVIVSSHGSMAALLVDALLDEREILLHGLGSLAPDVHCISGVADCGDGTLAPVLHIPQLIADAAMRPCAARAAASRAAARILLVEDSVTSRALLLGILEDAGYQVTAAVNGREATAALEAEQFELVVSDVEMPEMDGILLTEYIRRRPEWDKIPVILVTSRASPEDRRRGMQAGANAYVSKLSFDQAELLGAIRNVVSV
ncbi:MAG: response regulator [Leptospirales bacterium]|nr:response regulator [Leptospirales bacterium]